MQGNNQQIKDKVTLVIIGIVLVVGLVGFIFYKSSKIKAIVIQEREIRILTGEKYVVNYKIKPFAAKNERLNWITDNENAISVDHGVIVGKAPGTAVIWVSSKKDPTIKEKLIVNVSTKLGRFKERLVKVFSYEAKSSDVYVLGDRSTINFAEKTFYTTNNDMYFTYYYKEGIMIATPDAKDREMRSYVKFYLNDNTQECASTAYVDFCEDENLRGINKGKDMIFGIFKGYLGKEYTTDDI